MKTQQINRTSQLAKATHCRAGAAVVEFAIVAPIFFILLLGAFEFSRLNMIRNTASNAAYEAARLAMVPGATADEATDEANRLLGVLGTKNATVTINPATVTELTDEITVDITIPFADNAFMLPFFVGNMNILAQSTLKTERYRGF